MSAVTVTVRCFFFFFQAEDGIRDYKVTGVQTCALPISWRRMPESELASQIGRFVEELQRNRSEEHTSELQSPCNLVCRLLLEKKKNRNSKVRLRHILLSHPPPMRHHLRARSQ